MNGQGQHTPSEWWAYFVKNEPAEYAEFPPIVRNNMRMRAWTDFRNLKIAKGQWLPEKDED